ncbi:hypothetical protein MBLNU13_g06468t1 [Cladosporium sp. NU13]
MLYSAMVTATLAACALAAPKITSPAAGASLPVGGGSITVEWEDDGKAPKMSQLASFTLQLIVGGNTEANSKVILGGPTVTLGSATSTDFTGLAAPIAGEYTDGFYFRVISVATQGGTVTTYSDRFTITGMTGTVDPAIKSAVAAAGAAVPATVDATANNAAAAAGDPNANSGVPYAEQTGLIRYAPMQGVPPTKITKKDTKPLYPTSSYKIAVSFLPTPSATKTVTASQTFSADSMENTASPVPGPAGDAQRFLNRWKD